MLPLRLVSLPLLVLPAMLAAQPPACPIPAGLPRPEPELPSADQPKRVVPITGYTLSLIWQPEACHARRGRPGDFGCASPAMRTGFTLHGLWPDGDGPNRWPQYCRATPLLSPAQLRAGLCATPSVQLLQHEWAKHGTCMSPDPSRYFATETALFRRVRSPDMAALAARRDLTARDFQTAFAAANPGLTADMLRLNVNARGWLEEVWICLGRDRRPRACPAGAGGAAPGAALRIATPEG
ncbi:ribonuclease T2 family protein [Sphingomonas morindae]|uniref:Ribonuclease T n=1 Tax=Sphingomonas morindae TaxID=1541170 RepID=A0ABY4XAG6_9SPHN|nr:ribonuclease T [Sphingomonas morindae]USI73676.1 ribonuclease T [Sphingomonas morindae]